jgi:transposase-like protein
VAGELTRDRVEEVIRRKVSRTRADRVTLEPKPTGPDSILAALPEAVESIRTESPAGDQEAAGHPYCVPTRERRDTTSARAIPMAELKCPLCGSPVRVPSAETQTRYFCKKCHSPFHLNKSRDAVPGEPPDVELELEEIKQKLRQNLKRIPLGRVVAGLAAFVVVSVGLYYLLGPAQRLQDPAEEAGQALAGDDLDTLKSLATPGTADDVARWFDEVHPRLVQARAGWFGRDEVVEVHIGQEDQARRKGTVAVSIHPATLGSNRDISIADPTAATATSATPFDVEMVWTLDGWGRWRLDGRETYAKARPTP